VGSSSAGALGDRERWSMSVPLRTGVETDYICYEQRVWEWRTSGVQS